MVAPAARDDRGAEQRADRDRRGEEAEEPVGQTDVRPRTGTTSASSTVPSAPVTDDDDEGAAHHPVAEEHGGTVAERAHRPSSGPTAGLGGRGCVRSPRSSSGRHEEAAAR